MPVGRKTGGRSKGTPNRASAAREAEIAATGMTPLEYLTSIYRDVGADEAKRLDAAKAAAPYVHAKLSSIDATIGVDETIDEVGWIIRGRA